MSISSLRSPAVFAALALIALATLTPGSGPGGWGLGVSDPADLLVNIALFVPLGMAVRAGCEEGLARRPWLSPWARPMKSLSRPTRLEEWWRKPPRSAEPEARASGQETPAKHPSRRFGTGASPLRTIVVAAFLLSLSIELAQLSLIPGRDSSPWDVLANTIGAALGVGLPAATLALPLVPAWLISGWLLAPVPPSTPTWWGQWAHQFGSPAPFTGTIRAVSFNQVEAPRHRLGDSVTAQMKVGYLSPPIQLTVTLNPPRSPNLDRNQVAGIASGDGGEVIGLWQLGWDLELTWHARGTRWGLRQPALRTPGFLGSHLDTLPTISASVGAGRAFLEITPERRFGLRLGPWEGWRLFWPLTTPRPDPATLLSFLWTGVCLGLPVALWVAWRRKK